MMSKEELMKLKEDVTEIQERLKELTDEELEQVFGGVGVSLQYNPNVTESTKKTQNITLTNDLTM